jgi:class 3 adenylate cyclase
VQPETRYAKSGDLHIAYRVEGDGPFDVVEIPPHLWSMEFDAFQPEGRDRVRKLTSFARVISLDKRGTGLSDRVAGAPSLEERMDDVRAVMDAVGSSCAALVGTADGGSMSLLFAATYPERVFALALLRAKPRFVWAPDFPWAPRAEDYDRETDEFLRRRTTMSEQERYEGVAREEAIWTGRELSLEEFRERSRIFGLAVSPGSLLAMRKMNREIDVRAVLPAVQAPTLLMHRSADAPDAAETQDEPMASYMAERIPHAQLVEVAARGTWQLAMLPALEPFLTQAWEAHERRQAEPDRVLATVLFSDIVSSSEKAASLGDRAWRELLERHHQLVRRELARFLGQEVDTAGDGFFASFDGPARAIRCGCAIAEAIPELGLRVRVGLHTGECELVDGKVAGIAVHTGARVAAHAEPGEVLVSSTVKDLVAGSGIAFRERGTHELKGIPGEWRLYAVEG